MKQLNLVYECDTCKPALLRHSSPFSGCEQMMGLTQHIKR